MAAAGMLPSLVDDACGSQRFEPVGDGFWEPVEPRCTIAPVYEVRVTSDRHDEWITMCAEHTAWARASWSAVTGVRSIRR